MAYTVVGESRAHAEEREQLFLNDLVDPMASLTLLSELMNYDFSSHSLDDPDHRRADRVGVGHPGPGAEPAPAHRRHGHPRRPGRPPGHPAAGPRFVGTGPEVADQMEEWFTTDACDGFVIAATHLPGAYEDVVRMVVPELQRRGVFRDRYTGTTLREHLGLERPAVAARD